METDCIIIGGGIAGLQAAIQLGRYNHSVTVIDAGYGRSTLCRSYHNILGWPDGVSGEQLRSLGRRQAEQLGVAFVQDEVIAARKNGDRFELAVKMDPNKPYFGTTVLLATGILDRFPDLPGLVPCLGLSVYVCPDCDGYEIRQKRTIVLGSGDVGAQMALALSYWTDDLVYVNHDRKPVDDAVMDKLRQKHIEYVDHPIAEVIADNEFEFRGVKLHNAKIIEGEKGFIAFGGNKVMSSIGEQLGVERLENKHIVTDPRSKMTNVPNVWAAGDVGVHSEQVTIAMGEGSQAAIWIHKTLMQMKA